MDLKLIKDPKLNLVFFIFSMLSYFFKQFLLIGCIKIVLKESVNTIYLPVHGCLHFVITFIPWHLGFAVAENLTRGPVVKVTAYGKVSKI